MNLRKKICRICRILRYKAMDIKNIMLIFFLVKERGMKA
jgi:hypothetical protein